LRLKKSIGNELLLLALVSDEVEFCAGNSLELGRTLRAGQIVANAERIPFKFVDRREGLAVVWALGAGNCHACGFGAGIESISAIVGMVSDENFVFTAFHFEADGFQDCVGHGLAGQLGLNWFPISLKCFGVVERVCCELIQRRSNYNDADEEEVFHIVRSGVCYEYKKSMPRCTSFRMARWQIFYFFIYRNTCIIINLMKTTERLPLETFRGWFYAAAVYNLVWGGVTLIFPGLFFSVFSMELPNYPVLWRVVGMFVLVFAPGYYWAGRRPYEFRHFIVIGTMGKVAGAVGYIWFAAKGVLPGAFGWMILTNDLIWIPAFLLFLREVLRAQVGGWKGLLQGEV
jgi:small multidrug resistance pump